MSEVKHTPVPWHLHDMENGVFCGPDSYAIGICNARSRTDSDDCRNAAFIVRACNAHDELVGVLNNVRDLVYDAANGHPIDCKGLATEMLADVDAALAKAQEQS